MINWNSGKTDPSREVFLTPEISKQKSENIFSQPKPFLFKRFGKKKPLPIKRVELLYLPFYLFQVASGINNKEQKTGICLDGLIGDNLFFFKENLKIEDNTNEPVCPFILSLEDAQKKAADKYKWLQLEYKLRIKQKFNINEINIGKQIFYPFWVGYFQKARGYDFKIMDAVSGEIQGVKMRKVFLKALRNM